MKIYVIETREEDEGIATSGLWVIAYNPIRTSCHVVSGGGREYDCCNAPACTFGVKRQHLVVESCTAHQVGVQK